MRLITNISAIDHLHSGQWYTVEVQIGECSYEAVVASSQGRFVTQSVVRDGSYRQLRRDCTHRRLVEKLAEDAARSTCDKSDSLCEE